MISSSNTPVGCASAKPFAALFVFITLLAFSAHAEQAFRAGAAVRDITPAKPLPMWGYSYRKDFPAKSTIDPLLAHALVLETGEDRLAIVSLDLGRAPTARSTERIRKNALMRAGVDHVLLCASHTHHAPVLELVDEPGKGQGKFDDAVAYVATLEDTIVDAITEAADKLQDARIGWASRETKLNRNRQWPTPPKPVDPELFVMRIDQQDGHPLALLVNFAAHPTIHSIFDMRWSAEWPGQMYREVEAALGAPCLFTQGAAGDLSPTQDQKDPTIAAFGHKVAQEVIAIAQSIETVPPQKPSILLKHDRFQFKTRPDFGDTLTLNILRKAFFPEMVAMLDEVKDNAIAPEMNTLLLNQQLAIVTASGEFFCQHANRLKAESPAQETIFIGYCNGHHMYFPTREALEVGGKATEPALAWAEAGAGEQMIDKALQNIHELVSHKQEDSVIRK